MRTYHHLMILSGDNSHCRMITVLNRNIQDPWKQKADTCLVAQDGTERASQLEKKWKARS